MGPMFASGGNVNENGKLRKLVADLSLDKEMLQDVIRRNVWSASSFSTPMLHLPAGVVKRQEPVSVQMA
jgi:hypothetical protein